MVAPGIGVAGGGTSVTSSAKMHPTDHMSIDLVYAVDERSNSGGRYHLVTVRGQLG